MQIHETTLNQTVDVGVSEPQKIRQGWSMVLCYKIDITILEEGQHYPKGLNKGILYLHLIFDWSIRFHFLLQTKVCYILTSNMLRARNVISILLYSFLPAYRF